MSDQIISLNASPNQTFQTVLSVDGSPLTLNYWLYYNEMAECWVMDLYNLNGDLLLAATPLLTGIWPASNLLCQQGYLQIGSAYILDTSNEYIGATQDFPNNKNLGTGYRLLWSDTPTR